MDKARVIQDLARSNAGDVAATWEPIGSLIEWHRNPRMNQPVDEVAASIRAFGFGAPIVARRDTRVVIAGHTRLKAAQKLGMALVPVRFVDVDDAGAQALALADNRLGELADWDDQALAALLQELSAELDIGILGWKEEELLSLADVAGREEEQTPEPPPAAQVTPSALPATVRLLLGRCEERLTEVAEGSMDSCVCDPPYGLSEAPAGSELSELLSEWLQLRPWNGRSRGFMGREWDAFTPGPDVWRLVYRTLKPGGHLIAFSGSRTVDWLMLALRIAGFEIRTVGQWAFWTGYPPNHNVSLSDEATPAEREQLSKLGTALKPACEPWVLARKPPEGTLLENWRKYGTGLLQIDASRFAEGSDIWPGPSEGLGGWGGGNGFTLTHRDPEDGGMGQGEARHVSGRYPAGLVHFPKPSRAEREAGCEEIPPRAGADATGRKEGSAGLQDPRAGASRSAELVHNDHPTLKSIDLMGWLIRLVTPAGGSVIDPFMGSGSCGCAAVTSGYSYTGIEVDPRYHAISGARIRYWANTSGGR